MRRFSISGSTFGETDTACCEVPHMLICVRLRVFHSWRCSSDRVLFQLTHYGLVGKVQLARILPVLMRHLDKSAYDAGSLGLHC